MVGIAFRSDAALGKLRRYLLIDKGLDDIALLYIGMIGDRNTALEAGFHFRHVILEPLQRVDAARVNNDVVTRQAKQIAAAETPSVT